MLDDAYQIVAELRTEDESRIFIGTRKSDGAAVVVRVCQTPKDDAKNALTHFAADANLLANLQHRNLVQVLEGRWVDNQAFAIVTERPTVPTLEELLARGEELSSTRIAAILQEVNALLAWAREHGVVHRAITPASLFVEPGGDRVRASFVPRPLSITGVPGPDADVRTIGSLAWAMFTRESTAPQSDDVSLADVRPDLPKRLVEETNALLRANAKQEQLPDVRGYVALIAMADALRSGEQESNRIRTEILEEQRATHEQLETARQDLERQRSAHESRVVVEKKETLRERQREREAMQQAVARAHEEMQQALVRAKEEMERKIAEAREELERKLAQDSEELAPLELMAVEPQAETPPPSPETPRARPRLTLSKSDSGYRWLSTSQYTRRRVVLTTAGAFIVLIVASALTLGRHRGALTKPVARKTVVVASDTRPAATPLFSPPPPALGHSIFDSAGGSVTSGSSTASPTITDSIAAIDSALTAEPPKPRPKRHAVPKPKVDSLALPPPPVVDSLENPFTLPPRDSMGRVAPPHRDSIRRITPPPPTLRERATTDSTARRDSAKITAARSDSAARDAKLTTPGPDASVRDSAARENLAQPRRPDSLAPRPVSRDSTSKPRTDTSGPRIDSLFRPTSP